MTHVHDLSAGICTSPQIIWANGVNLSMNEICWLLQSEARLKILSIHLKFPVSQTPSVYELLDSTTLLTYDYPLCPTPFPTIAQNPESRVSHADVNNSTDSEYLEPVDTRRTSIQRSVSGCANPLGPDTCPYYEIPSIEPTVDGDKSPQLPFPDNLVPLGSEGSTIQEPLYIEMLSEAV